MTWSAERRTESNFKINKTPRELFLETAKIEEEFKNNFRFLLAAAPS